MPMKLSTRISMIKPSPTLAITMKANALKAQGKDIIGFGAGEPDFDTPDHIKKAAVKAIESGFTKYTPVGGIDELKDAIAAKMERDNGLKYSRSQIAVSCGAKHTLYNLAQVLFDEGDEVIIQSPYWVSYPDIVVLAGAHPIVLETKEADGFKFNPRHLEKRINKRTKAVILNSPSNPTGVAYTREELEVLADIIVRKRILVISDEIYEKIVYDDFPFSSIASINNEIFKSTVVVNGVSKAYAMTGWRIGYAAGPEEIISAVTKIQSQNTSNPTSIAQKAAVEAYSGDQSVVTKMVAEFQKRRNVIVAGLNDIEGMSCMTPEGAFYVFPNISGFFGRSHNGKIISGSSEFADYLLDEAGVAVVPGADFGQDNYMRLSYATSMKNIEEGIRRIKKAAERLG